MTPDAGRGTPSAAPLRALSESELIATWEGGADEDPLVSICCTAFDQVLYIRDAVEGFLAQRTRFAFEVLLHDDASTDGTADIIREYAASHPRIVRAVLREENLYRRNGMTLGNVLPLARGRWIAICEGDDYWIDPHKLQSQIDRLERDGTAMSAHRAVRLQPDGVGHLTASRAASDGVVPLEEVLEGVFPAASTVFSRSALDEFGLFRDAARPRVGDIYMQAIAAIPAGCSYLSDVASVYRERAAGSWSASATTVSVAHDAVDTVRCMVLLSERYPDAASALRESARRRMEGAVVDFTVAHLDGHRVRPDLAAVMAEYAALVTHRARVISWATMLPRGIGVLPLRAYRNWRDRRVRRSGYRAR